MLESRDVPAWFAVQINGPGEGSNGQTASTYASGTLHTKTEYELGSPGVAILDAPTAGEAIREALTGSIQMFVPPPTQVGYTELSFPFTPSTVGFTIPEHKPYLLRPLQPTTGGGGGEEGGPPTSPPPSNIWLLNLEDLSHYPGYCDWDYDDRSWIIQAVPLTTPPTGAETVAGRMWADLNEDGIQDTDEPGMPWLSVQLLKDGSPFGVPATTDEDGNYSFHFVRDPAADYTVQFSKPNGYAFTDPFVGGDRTIDSDADEYGISQELFTTSNPPAYVGGGLALVALYGRKWTIPNVDQAEGNGTTHQMTFTVKRLVNVGLATSVGFKTIDGSAIAGSDYDYLDGTLNFAPGQATATVTVTIKEDTTKENDEEFFLVLKDPDFAVMPDGSTPEGRVTPFGRGIIRNDDFPTGYFNAWADWVVDPRTSKDTNTSYKNGRWMRGWDGDTPTYLTPTGTPWVHSMIDEGDYLKHNSVQPYGAFEFVVDWRIADAGQAAVPMRPTGDWAMAQTAEHFGNSGVYIYNMYEVQINSTNVPFGQEVPDPPPPPPGQKPPKKTQVTPGWPYEVPVPAGQGIYNYSVAPGSWNRMRVKFTPPVLSADKTTVDQAAKLKVSFEFANGLYVTYGGADGWELLGLNGTKLKGTGSRQTGPASPQDVGRIFLQSHWGSLVEFKNPFFV